MGVDLNQIWIETKSHLKFKSIHFIDWSMLETPPNPLLPGCADGIWNLCLFGTSRVIEGTQKGQDGEKFVKEYTFN